MQVGRRTVRGMHSHATRGSPDGWTDGRQGAPASAESEIVMTASEKSGWCCRRGGGSYPITVLVHPFNSLPLLPQAWIDARARGAVAEAPVPRPVPLVVAGVPVQGYVL